MFDPTIGRWTSEDPIGFEAADPNLFRYTHNNPTNFTDPSGLHEGWDDRRMPPAFTPSEGGTYHKYGKWYFGGPFVPGEREGFAQFGPGGVKDVPRDLHGGNVTIVANETGYLWLAQVGTMMPFPARGIRMFYDGKQSKEVTFIQLYKLEERIYKGRNADYELYDGKINIPSQGERAFSSSKSGTRWYVDSCVKDSPEYVQTRGEGGWSRLWSFTGTYLPEFGRVWMWDPPTAAHGALLVAHRDLVENRKQDIRQISSHMIVSTYLVYKGAPFYRVDWESSVSWEKGDRVPSLEQVQIRLSNHGSKWNDPKMTPQHYDLIKPYPADKRIWTKPPEKK